MIGRSGAGEGPSLLLNGHIDVVPAEQPDRWASPPFEPRRDGDRLYGRGAGDMKGGFAMAALALDALRATAPDAIAGPLTFVSVIEEECTGNGTLAAARAGVLADAVILPEPTGLELLLAGVGILWLDVVITGRSAHAEAADRVVNPVDLAIRVVEALRDLEREMNAEIELSMDGVAHPYNINVGTFVAGDWPSSVPAIATLRLRVGHPTAWTADEAEARVRRAIARDRRTVAPGPSPGDPAFGLPRAGVRAAAGRSARGARGGGARVGARRPTPGDPDGEHDRCAALPERLRRPGALLRTGRARHPRDRRVGRAVVDRRRRANAGALHRRLVRGRALMSDVPSLSILEPVKLRSGGEHVADRLVTAIALGEFVPGQRLPSERELASTLGVSRTTVREAIQRLAALGYVDVRRGRTGGAFVLEGMGPEANEMIRRTLLPEWSNLEGLLDFRQLIEPLIARTAASRIAAADAAAIRDALSEYVDAGDDREASRAADQAVHAAIAKATGNPYLASLSGQIRRQISLGFGAEPYSRAIRARAVKDHTALAEAVIGGKAATAGRIAERHFRLTETVLRDLVSRIDERANGAQP